LDLRTAIVATDTTFICREAVLTYIYCIRGPYQSSSRSPVSRVLPRITRSPSLSSLSLILIIVSTCLPSINSVVGEMSNRSSLVIPE
jgi:hypothetical protein